MGHHQIAVRFIKGPEIFCQPGKRLVPAPMNGCCRDNWNPPLIRGHGLRPWGIVNDWQVEIWNEAPGDSGHLWYLGQITSPTKEWNAVLPDNETPGATLQAKHSEYYIQCSWTVVRRIWAHASCNRGIDPETAPLSRLGAATATLRDKLIQLIQTLSESLSNFRLIQSCQKPH